MHCHNYIWQVNGMISTASDSREITSIILIVTDGGISDANAAESQVPHATIILLYIITIIIYPFNMSLLSRHKLLKPGEAPFLPSVWDSLDLSR